ncbi:MAG TPA: tripartite tricarboxylate transporter substrate binding protein [Burkholderiales bacterium]
MRGLLRLVLFLIAGAALAAPGSAYSQSWPARPVRIIVPFPPGNGTDILARLMTPKMTQGLGQAVIVENRGGANGMIGAEAVAHAAPDGTTILFTTPSTHVTSIFLSKNLPYDPTKDFTPITAAVEPVTVMTINPSLPVNSVKELIEYAKKNPGKLNYSSPGVGAVFHMSGELFKLGAGVDIVHVPYKGASPALAGVIAGEVSIGFNSLASVLPHMRSGKLKVLAVLEANRYAGLPQVPTVGEFVPGFVKPASWFGLFGPAALPAPVLARLHEEIVKTLKDRDVSSKIDELAMTVIANTPEQFSIMLKSGIDQYGRLIKAAGIQPE